jgi:hypothetical protein
MNASMTVDHLRPEAELILLACGTGEELADVDRARALMEDVTDWPHLLQLSLKNRILPLVHQLLRANDYAGATDEIRAQFETWFRRFQGKNLLHVRTLLTLLFDLEAAGIDASPYKGPVLAEAFYGDLGLRQFYDLDVLVRKEDVDRAREVLLASGFVEEDELEGTAREEHLSDDCELHFRHATDGVLVELHWDVLPRNQRLGFDIEPYWERRVPFTLAGREVRVLDPEDRLIVLCIHGGEKHRWSRLQMLADVARIVARPELRWDVVLERAHEFDREPTVLLGVYLAWVLLGAEPPRDVLEEASTPAVRTQAALTLGRLLRLDSGLPSRSEWTEFLTCVDDRARARGHDPGPPLGVRHYGSAILTPEWTDRQALKLPRRASFLYYLYRPLRLLKKHGRRLFGRL